MKRTSTILFCILFTTGVFSYKIKAQCLNQVSHTTGTQIVNGTSVTVTSSGTVDTNTVHCPSATEPYFVGYNWTTGVSGDGSYTFQFSPPVDSLTLNFSGISDQNVHKEIVKLNVNGLHYQIPSAGIPNGCDSLAILTSSGNITGCTNCAASGWKGTTISGPITSLTVVDSVVSGSPSGAIFSLYLCNSATTEIQETNSLKFKVLPKPANDLLIIEGLNLITTSISMIDLVGQKMAIDPAIQTDQIFINCSDLPAGIYIILIESDSLIETHKVIIK